MPPTPRPGLLARLRAAFTDRDSLLRWRLVANDGIIATAATLEGFAGAGAGRHSLLIAATVATIAGMLAAGGAEWSEAAAERDADLSTAAYEAAELARDPAAELIELAAFYEAKGLSAEVAHEVARQLMDHDPLAAQLEVEHGIRRLATPSDTVRTGVGAALAFALGAAIPLCIMVVAPIHAERWAIAAAAIVSLTVTSIVGARTGHMSVTRTLVRTLVVGVGTMLASYLVGDLLF